MTEEGLYLHLYHGRPTTDEVMGDFGLDGPLIGPIHYCHTTYAADVKFEFANKAAYEKYVDKSGIKFHVHEPSNWYAGELWIVQSMIFFDGIYYGDWSVFYLKEEDI